MAVSSIIQVATWMNSAIKATTPDVRSGIPYRKASGACRIQEQEPNGRDSQRNFQIQMAPIVDLGDFVGPCYELHHEMTVVMRYMHDPRNRDDWDDLQLMAADDAKRIVLALTRPPLSAPWSDGGIFNIVPTDHVTLERNTKFDGVWEQSVTFDCLYANEATTRDFECMTIYPDYAALSATDGTTAWLGSARDEVRRLTDGTLYYWDGVDGSWLGLYQPGDVPSFASTAAMEAATLYGEKLGAISGAIYQIQSGTATLLSAGGGLVTEHTTLASLYAQAGSDGDRALLKTTADVIIASARHDGTRWRLEGLVDLAAAGTEGATVFAGYISDTGLDITWTASGISIATTVAGSSGTLYLQAVSSAMTWYTDLSRYCTLADVTWDQAQPATTRYAMAGAAWGVAGAHTYEGHGGVLSGTASTKTQTLIYGLTSGVSLTQSLTFSGSALAQRSACDMALESSAKVRLAGTARDTVSNAGDFATEEPTAAAMGVSGNSLLDVSARIWGGTVGHTCTLHSLHVALS